jgi:hypothetical protein
MHSLSKRRKNLILAQRSIMALAPLALAVSASAAEFELGEISGNARGSLSVGATWSAEDANPYFINQNNASSIGLGGGYNPTESASNDDSRLNFRKKNQLVSSPVILLGELEMRYKNYGSFLRGKAWYDYTLENESVDFGNAPNGYQHDSKLDDSRFDELAQFQGVALLDAYVFGDFNVGESPLHLRFGKQVVNWGEGLFFQSGINEVNPFDVAALVRPGSQLKEAYLPSNMLYGNFGITDNFTLEAFYKLEWRKTVLPGCGTFFAPNDFIQDGCDALTVLNSAFGVDDNQALATNTYVHRVKDDEARDGGQFGVAGRYYIDSIGTEVGAYAMNVHSTVPYASAQLFDLNTFAFDFGGAGAPAYLAKYPEDIRIFGLSFNTNVLGTSVFGEYSFRPNQPVSLFSSDLLNSVLAPAFGVPTFGLPLADDVAAATLAAPGSKFDGYDRLKTSQLTLGFIKSFQQVLGADSVTVIGESAFKYVHDLPSIDERRYGNIDNYGNDFNSVAGCATVPGGYQYQKYACSGDGFVSDFSWGYRLNVEFSYLNVVAGVNLTPYVFFGHDVKGWSHDAELVEDRLRGTVGLRADYAKKYTVDLSWSGTGNTSYAMTDRDFIALSARMGF